MIHRCAAELVGVHTGNASCECLGLFGFGTRPADVDVLMDEVQPTLEVRAGKHSAFVHLDVASEWITAVARL